jgi:hypothetical protein
MVIVRIHECVWEAPVVDMSRYQSSPGAACTAHLTGAASHAWKRFYSVS